MKPFDVSDAKRQDDPHELPQFDLEYLVDDIDYPSEVMVVPDGTGDDPGSQWLLADIRYAVPLEWVR